MCRIALARNLNYWDSASSFAGEVENPGKTYPRALLACVSLVVLCYGLPILVGTGAASVAAAAATAAESGGSISSGTGGQEEVRWSLWVDGYFAEVAEAIGGRWLGVWVVLAAAAANIGLFEAEMTSDALQVMGMVSDVTTNAAVAPSTQSGDGKQLSRFAHSSSGLRSELRCWQSTEASLPSARRALLRLKLLVDFAYYRSLKPLFACLKLDGPSFSNGVICRALCRIDPWAIWQFKAERGMLPAVFAKRGSYGISGHAVIASGTGVAFLGLLGFEAVVEILNLLCEFPCTGLFGFCPGMVPKGRWVSGDGPAVGSCSTGKGSAERGNRFAPYCFS